MRACMHALMRSGTWPRSTPHAGHVGIEAFLNGDTQGVRPSISSRRPAPWLTSTAWLNRPVPVSTRISRAGST